MKYPVELLGDCFVCDKPVYSGSEYHTGHEYNCPNLGHEDDDDWERVDCDCSVFYHPKCCPVCNTEAAK